MNLATHIQTGTPKADGRYVVFIRCQAAAARDWVEPIIMTWHSECWNTSFIPKHGIIGWLGPLPVLKVTDIEATAPAPPEFDL